MVKKEGIDRFALSLLEAYDTGIQISPISESFPDLDSAVAYRIAHRITTLRQDRGERMVGCKIGFTNRTIWPIYGVTGPMWGPVWNTTLHELSDGSVTLPNLPQPRLEPEIIFGLKSTLRAGMPLKRIAECIEWVSHGFEVVFSPFPDWRFTGADTAAAFGLHGALYVGDKHELAPDLADSLSDLRIELSGSGDRRLKGSGSDVLGGPIQALSFLLDTFAKDPEAPSLSPGTVVTTGTLTDAVPIAPGESWKTRIDGVGLPGAEITFRQSG